jgi:hypothetical protein
MSTSPLVRDPDLGRLLDDGYSVVVQGGHLVITHIPYVTPDREVRYGFLTYPVTVAGDRIVSGTDHRLWFGGETPPCNEHGIQLTCANPEPHAISEGQRASYMLSSKPSPTGYPSEYEKVKAYTRIVSHPAAAIDPTATATPGGAWQEVEDDLPFVYRDTASTRAGLTEVNKVFRGERIGLIGLGGSGGYILDQLAKTPVDTIACFDGDTFENHNAFRGPGAPSLELLRERPNKAEYFAKTYSNMHTGITAHPELIDASNLSLLGDCTFVFLAIDDTTAKAPILAYLAERGIPSIDVGMGVEEIDGKISGLLRTTLNRPGTITDGISMTSEDPDERPDDYSRNIQIADLNARNALDAVARWKRYLGLYADGSAETSSTYSIFTNRITSDGGAQDGTDDED